MGESPMKLKGLDGPVAGRSLEPVKIRTMIMSAPPQLHIQSGEEETASTRPAAAVTFYGSAPPELWTEVLPTDVQDISHERHSIQGTDSSDLDQLLHIDPSELQIDDKIAEGGQAEVYLAVRTIEGIEESIWPSSFDDKSQELAFEVDVLELETKIGDYESSESVVGTGFWRAPEILEALKNNVKPRFSPKADVYSFGMVCYEILTGHHPFQGHPRSNYDLVLSGQRPELPPFVNEGMRSLLHMCWHPDPLQRPEWDRIKSHLHLERLNSRLPTVKGINDCRLRSRFSSIVKKEQQKLK